MIFPVISLEPLLLPLLSSFLDLLFLVNTSNSLILEQVIWKPFNSNINTMQWQAKVAQESHLMKEHAQRAEHLARDLVNWEQNARMVKKPAEGGVLGRRAFVRDATL